MQETADPTESTTTVRRGRKRKSAALEAEASPPVPIGKAARMSDAQAAEAGGVSQIAPVARLY